MKTWKKWTFLSVIIVALVAVFVSLWMRSRPVPVVYENIAVQQTDIQRTTQISGIIAELYKQAGDHVRVGDAIAKIKVIPDMSQLAAAESRVRLAKYNMENARKTFERDSTLLLQKVIAQEDYDKSRLQYIADLEELQAAEDNLSITRDGVAAKASEGYTNTIVRATISGTVLDVPVKVGNSVILSNTFNDGTTIATVADMQDLLFVGSIDETEVGKLREGMQMDLIIGALNDQRFSAKLEYIAPKGTENNGAMMFEIKGAAVIPDSVTIRAGYSANAEIVLERRAAVLSIPEYAVSFEGDSSFVQLLTDTVENTYTRQPVITGLSDGINIEVKSGLNQGDLVRGNAQPN